MNTKHTPGPWRVLKADGKFRDEYFRDIYISCDAEGEHIGEVFREGEEREANARLIAAAPDLLFCLQVICEHAGEDFDRLDGMLHLTEAKKAIAKATGGTT